MHLVSFAIFSTFQEDTCLAKSSPFCKNVSRTSSFLIILDSLLQTRIEMHLLGLVNESTVSSTLDFLPLWIQTSSGADVRKQNV